LTAHALLETGPHVNVCCEHDPFTVKIGDLLLDVMLLELVSDTPGQR